jgi:hypothetical protein
MPLLNYTTEIAAGKTASQVQSILAKAGAKRLLFEYGDDGEPVAIAFEAPTSFGLREFVLPTDPDAVLRVLRKQHVAPRYQNYTHARRVAWRIVKDWIEAQLAIIQTEMVTLDQVMLPYMRTGDTTVYALYREQQLQIETGEKS